MNNLEKKHLELKRFIESKGKEGVVIAFSGGLDSSTLAAVCHQILGPRVAAVTADSPTYTSDELEGAKKIAKEIGINLHFVKTNELSDKNFSNNPENRCYYCKLELLKTLQSKANQLGFKVVFEGTNSSDLNEHRPGYRAIKENDYVYSPWVEAGFSKEEIRLLAKKEGLSVTDKPSNACLASRIPYNETITADKLRRIEKAEQIVKELTSACQLRVRDHNGLARIEVGREERKLLCNVEILDKLAAKLKAIGFNYVTMDAEGYQTGTMLLTINEKPKQLFNK
jgi:pyridinium-3,5-biscarboxylic acid mononucleotide sulfurtransferase